MAFSMRFIVDVDPAVIHIARQPGKKTVGIGKGLSEPALGQDLRIGFLYNFILLLIIRWIVPHSMPPMDLARYFEFTVFKE